jgi:hypothetical protein
VIVHLLYREEKAMNEQTGLARLCEFYIRRVTFIGAAYAIIPTIVWFGAVFLLLPFRSVYVLRLVLSLAVGGPVAGFVNRFGVRLWLTKHESSEGPATVLDGVLIGAACGFGTAFLPPLTSLISSHHIEEAKAFIIIAWFAATVIGALIGGVLAAAGRKHLPAAGARKQGGPR